ncbi:MAG: LamG-like jellyroll fold domain-containing protein [Pseudomonadota bacterium]
MGALVRLNGRGTNSGETVFSADDGGFDRSLKIDERQNDEFTAFSNNSGGTVGSGLGVGDGEVFFVAVSYTGGANSLLYVDLLDGTETATLFFDSTGTSGNTLTIGTNPGFPEFFDGSIDNAFVFDRALSQAEIEQVRDGLVPTTVIPVPATLPLMLAGLGLFAAMRRRG